MNQILSLSFYLITIIILILLYYLIRSWIVKKFASRRLKYTSKVYPYVLGITVLSIGFTTTTYWKSLIYFVIDILYQKTGFKIHTFESFDLYTFIVYLIFSTAVCIMLIYYAKINLHLLPINNSTKGGDTKLTNERKYSLTPPPHIPDENPVFWERIKELFELKIRNSKFLYDKEYHVLYSVHHEGLHDYITLIYCNRGIGSKLISNLEANEAYNLLYNKIAPKITKNLPNGEYILDCFYLLEKGSFEKDNCPIVKWTEDDLLNNLIDFTQYLEKVKNDYLHTHLPFSSNTENLSLKDTFISPKFNNGIEDLDKYLDKFLEEKGNRQIAILGSYGMGKTSFLKYYSYKLAKEILGGDKIKRFPVFISLTNTSPMHEGIKTKCESFVSKNLGVDNKLFEKLIHRGRIIFLLDGFDEMGFIGTYRQRLKQLDSIWRLATKNNKIIISGRPSYFPTEDEMLKGLNLESATDLVPNNIPYCSRIELDEFSDTQIRSSISKFYNDENTIRYFQFIIDNESIHDLCKRPSMLHIVREMLPVLHEKYKENEINSRLLMDQYIDHWMDRQNAKNIISVLEKESEKRNFIKEFFRDLAADNYDSENGNISLSSYQVSESLFYKLKEKLFDINEEDKEREEAKSILFEDAYREGLENEIMTGYFIQRNDDSFKFVHKSFFEYFVANKILELLKKRNFSHPLISGKNWSKEIASFIFDPKQNSESKRNQSSEIPYLIKLTSRNDWVAMVKFIVLKSFSLANKLMRFNFLVLVLLGMGVFLSPSAKFFNYFNIALFIFGIPAGVRFREWFFETIGKSDLNVGIGELLKKLFSNLGEVLIDFSKSTFGKVLWDLLLKLLFVYLILLGLCRLSGTILDLFPEIYSYTLLIILNKINIFLLVFFVNPVNSFLEILIVFCLQLVLLILFGGFIHVLGAFVGMILERFIRVKFSAKAYYIEATSTSNFEIKNFDVIVYYFSIYNTETVIADCSITEDVNSINEKIRFENVVFSGNKVILNSCTLRNCSFEDKCYKIKLNNCDLSEVIFFPNRNTTTKKKKKINVKLSRTGKLDKASKVSLLSLKSDFKNRVKIQLKQSDDEVV